MSAASFSVATIITSLMWILFIWGVSATVDFMASGLAQLVVGAIFLVALIFVVAPILIVITIAIFMAADGF